MNTATSLVVTFASLIYIGLMFWALATTRQDAPLRNLSRAIKLYGWAIVAESAVLVARLVQARWFWSLLAIATIAAAGYCQRSVRKRRDLRAARVMADAERTVRDFGRGGIW